VSGPYPRCERCNHYAHTESHIFLDNTYTETVWVCFRCQWADGGVWRQSAGPHLQLSPTQRVVDPYSYTIRTHGNITSVYCDLSRMVRS